jgi:AraC-like DNA-binding protein
MPYDGSKVVWDNRRARSTRVCFGEVLYAPGGSCGPRIERDYELLFLHSGALAAQVDGHRRTLTAGCAALLLPGQREHFRFSTTAETHHSWCSITPGFMPPPLRRTLRRAPFSVPYAAPLGYLLAAGLSMDPVRSRGAAEILEQLGLLLFKEYLNTAREHHDTHDCAVRRAARYLAVHFADRDALPQALRAAGVSRNTLISHFKRELKTTPARYLWRLRTERGIQMLAETGLSIGEIALKCGFKDAFHFSRLVRQLQGVPPREVRRQAWAGD